MYNSLEKGSVLKEYLDNNCLHLIDSLKGDTGILCNTFDVNNWKEKKVMPITFQKTHFLKDLLGKTGVYAILSIPTNIFYIGSAIDFGTRLNNHYSDSKNPALSKRPLYSQVKNLGGWNNFIWEPVVCTKNYYRDFITSHMQYASDYKTFRILQTFTQYEVRVIEQSLQYYLSSSLLNGPGDVTFTVSWDPNEDRKSKLGERSITAITKKGVVYQFNSIVSAANMLGTSRKTISTVLNYENHYVECPNINIMCRFIDTYYYDDLSPVMKEGTPYKSPYLLPDRKTRINFKELPVKVICAFDRFNQLHSTYSSRTEAAEKCGLKDYYSVSRYINKRYIPCVIDDVKINLLFAQNPNTKGGRNKVQCLDTITKEIMNFKSVSECAHLFGVTSTSHFIKIYIKQGKLYKGKYLITYKT